MYLTETTLGPTLKDLFNEDFIHNKKFGNFRPDYRSDSLKLIVEFDGYRHYSSSSNIVKDYQKDREFKNLGYKIVRIPYFVQLDSKIIKLLFDLNKEINNVYPHGFIDSKALLPADFCELGVNRFEDDLNITFKVIKNDITSSLKDKIKTLDKNIVLPPSLFYLLD